MAEVMVTIPRWVLSAAGDDGSVVMSFEVPPRPVAPPQLAITFDVDCAASALKPTKVWVPNASALQIHHNPMRESIFSQLPVFPRNGDVAPSRIEYTLDASLVEVEYETQIRYATMQGDTGIPRFFVRARSAVTFKMTSVPFTQTYDSLKRAWGPEQAGGTTEWTDTAVGNWTDPTESVRFTSLNLCSAPVQMLPGLDRTDWVTLEGGKIQAWPTPR